MVDIADKNAYYRHNSEEDERLTTTHKPYTKTFMEKLKHSSHSPSIGTTTAPSTTYSLSPDPAASELSSSPSVSKHKWYSSDKFASNQFKHSEHGKTTNAHQSQSYISSSPISGGIEKLKSFFASEKNSSSGNVAGAIKMNNYETHKGYDESSETTLKARQKLANTYNKTNDFKIKSDTSSSVPAPLYDYKEGVLFQRNYQWPDKKGFKDESDYTVQQSFDRDGFRETHGKMERETGDKRGMLARETWSRIGQDQEIKEEKVKFHHRGPLDELPRALPPGTKDKIMDNLIGTDEYSKYSSSKILGGNSGPSIFPRFIEDAIAEGSGYISDHSTSKKFAHDSASSEVVTTRENITEQSYSDEYLRASGFKQPTKIIHSLSDDKSGTTKYYRKAVEDENITFTGPTSEARDFAKSDFESYSGGSERTYMTQGASSSYAPFTENIRREHESKELSEGSIIEDSYKRYKTEDIRTLNQGISSEDQILASHPGFSSAVVPLRKHASVQYDIKPSYRVVFEKLTRRERITEREAAEKENAATQTYATLPIPMIKDMSVSTPSLIEPELKDPEPCPKGDEDDDRRYHELSKSLGDIALSIKDLNEKLKDKDKEPIPQTVVKDLDVEDRPPIKPPKTSIPMYDEGVQTPIYRPPREEEQSAKTVQNKQLTEYRKPSPPLKIQSKTMKTRRIKKVRMEETENVFDDFPEVEIARSKYYFGDGSDATFESGKGSLSKAVQLKNGGLARDVSQAYYTKAAVNGGPSNGFKQYVTYEKRASRRFQSPENAYKANESEIPENAGKLKYDNKEGYNEDDFETVSEPRSMEKTGTEIDSGKEKSSKNNRKSKTHTETAETFVTGDSIPEDASVVDDDEPEIVEFYKKTQTHKHKKIVIKPDGLGGTEKIIMENIYDPPIIKTNNASSTSSRKTAGAESNFHQQREDKSYRSTSSHSGGANWSGNRSKSGAARILSPQGSARTIQGDQIGVDNDSGIMNSPPYPATLSPAESFGSNYLDRNGDSSIHYVPHRFRRSVWQQQSPHLMRDNKRGKSLNRLADRRRDLSPEFKDWQYTKAKGRAAIGTNIPYGMPLPNSDFVDSYRSQNRSRDYERAWEELSERQSLADDTEEWGRDRDSYSKRWDGERGHDDSINSTSKLDISKYNNNNDRDRYIAVSTSERGPPRSKQPLHSPSGIHAESYYQEKFRYSPERESTHNRQHIKQDGVHYNNDEAKSRSNWYPSSDRNSSESVPREVRIERATPGSSINNAANPLTKSRSPNLHSNEFQPDFYIPTVPVNYNYRGERASSINSPYPNQVVNHSSNTSLSREGFRKFEEGPPVEWRNSFKDPKTGMMVEEEGRKSNSKFSQVSKKDSPESRKTSTMKDFSRKFFPKTNFDNKFQIKASN